MQDEIRKASEDNFSIIQRFVKLKKGKGVLSPEEVAHKIWELFQKRLQTNDLCVHQKISEL